jgi:hypothetical protein
MKPVIIVIVSVIATLGTLAVANRVAPALTVKVLGR